MIPKKPPSSSSSRARPGHAKVQVPDHILQSFANEEKKRNKQLVTSSSSENRSKKLELHQQQREGDGFEDDPFPERHAYHQARNRTDIDASSSSDDEFHHQKNEETDSDNDDHGSSSSPPRVTTTLLSALSREKQKAKELKHFERSIGWDSLRLRTAELEKDRARLTTSEASLLDECSDLRSLQAKVNSLTSELRSLESLYPTQTAVLEVVADAVDELSSALVTRHATNLSQLKKEKSVEYTKVVTEDLLSELKEICAERDEAVKRIASVRVWRDQLASAMIRQQAPLQQSVIEQRRRMEKEEKEKESTMQQLKQTFELNSQMITQIAQAGPLEVQVDKALDDLNSVSAYKEELTTHVSKLWEETETTRRKLVKEEQRAIDDARVIRAKQNMSSRHLEELSKILFDLNSEKEKLQGSLENLQKETKYVTAEFYRREGEAFEGWTPRPSFINGVEARQDWSKKNEKFLLDQQKHSVASAVVGGVGVPSTTTTAVPGSTNNSNNNKKGGTGGRKNGSQSSPPPMPSSSTTAAGVPHLPLGSLITSTSPPSPPPATATTQHQHQLTSSSSKTGNLAHILDQINSNFLSPIFSSIGVDTRGQNTTQLLETVVRKAVTTQRDVRRTNDECRKIDRLASGIHAPVRLTVDRVKRGFEENVDNKEYLMRFMGAATVPSFLREPRPVANEKWNFAETEENCFDYLVTLSEMSRKMKSERADQQKQQNDLLSSSAAALSSASASPSGSPLGNSNNNNNNNQQNNHNRTRLHYETCVLRTLAKCALMNSNFSSTNDGGGQQQNEEGISSSGIFSGVNNNSNANAADAAILEGMSGGGGDGLDASLQFPLARKYAYHILHHGNLFKEFSPIIRAALMTFACSLPLDFIETPMHLLRSSMDRFLSDLRSSSTNLNTMINKIISSSSPITSSSSSLFSPFGSNSASNTFSGNHHQQQSSSSSSFATASKTGDALFSSLSEAIVTPTDAVNNNSNSADKVTTSPALNPIFSILLSAFTKEFGSPSSSSSSEISSSNTGGSLFGGTSNSNSGSVGHLGPIELLQLQHALQLDTSIGNFIQEMIKSFLLKKDDEKMMSLGGGGRKQSLGDVILMRNNSSTFTGNNNTSKGTASIAKQETTGKTTIKKNATTTGSVEADQRQKQSSVNQNQNQNQSKKSAASTNNNTTSNQKKNEGSSNTANKSSSSSKSFFLNAAFDFQAAIGVRPLKETDAPGLVLRLIIDFFLRRHDVFTRTLEMSICSVARPLGETSQMIVTEDDIVQAIAGLKVESWRCHVGDGCVVHPSFVRAIDSLFFSSSNQQQSGGGAMDHNSSILLSNSNANASSSGVLGLTSSDNSNNTQQWVNPIFSISNNKGGASKTFLRLKQSFVSELIHHEFSTVQITNRLLTQLYQELQQHGTGYGLNLVSANNHNNSLPHRPTSATSSSGADQHQHQYQTNNNNNNNNSNNFQIAMKDLANKKVYDVNDVITYLWTKSFVYEE